MSSDAKRIVITGMGLVTPLGAGVAGNWQRLLAAESGIGPITRFKVDDLPCRIGGEVPLDPAHPQYGLRELRGALGCRRTTKRVSARAS